MPSKLDYLSKYTSSSATGDGENEKRKRKQSKKEKKKKKRKNEGSRSRSLASNLVDEDDFPVRGGSDDHHDFENDDEDDGPVVVSGNVTTVEDNMRATAPRGVWKTVATTTGESADSKSVTRGRDMASSGTTRGRRHDSSSSSEGERARPRQRCDSSDDDDEGMRGDNRRRRRYDSSDEEEDIRRGGAKRRQRYDSSSDDDNTHRKESNQSRRRMRHDSDDEESMEGSKPQARPRRHDSSDEEKSDLKPRRPVRYDSSDEDDDRRQPRTRHDSSDEGEDNKHKDKSRNRRFRRRQSSSDSNSGSRRKRRQRYDSEESDNEQGNTRRRKRHDSDDDDDDDEGSSDGGKARMSSGHKAGLQNYKDFDKSERKIQAKKHRDAQRMVDKHGMGETVYRDKDGRKTQAELDGTNQVDVTMAAERLNRGKVQQEASDAKARELMDIQNSGFARYRDDDRLEEQLKNEVRKDDPMARYAMTRHQQHSRRKHRDSGEGHQQAPSKPVYKGPPPKPNRFGIRPGYRWDGNDRGNGFEDKILAKKFSTNLKAEQAYKWSSADM